MSSLDLFTESFSLLQKAWQEDRLAHAYLIGGSPTGAGLSFAQALLKLLYCEGSSPPCGSCANCHRVERRAHPDIFWLESEKKSRIVSVDQVRGLIDALSHTAFSGGWKAAVILACDRMKEEAANAFLKTLEEPPHRTLLLLITDQIQALLPTIVSRCHKIVLDERSEDPAWKADLLDILATHGVDSGYDALLLAGQLRALLDTVRARIEETEEGAGGGEEDKEVLAARAQAKLIKERTDLLRCLQHWQRDILVCACGASDEALHFRGQAAVLRRLARGRTPAMLIPLVQGVQDAVRLLERNVPESVALETYLLASRRS